MTDVRRVTLKDVAAIAGVDASLVSRVLSKDTSISIQDSTRQRILDAVAETNYRPSAAARSLRTQRLSALALVIPDLTNPVYAPIAQGAQERASSSDVALLLASDTEGPARAAARDLVRLLAEDRVDGLLIASGGRSSELSTLIRGIEKPLVLVNRAIRGIPSSIVDDEAGSRMATDHLLAMQHRSIAHLAGPVGIDTTSRRSRGWRAALDAAHVDGPKLHSASWRAADGYEAAKGLLTGPHGAHLTAVFVANVTLAIGLYRAAHELGRSIPGDLSVVALHDYDLAAMLVPALTTVAMPLRELGRTAVDQLLQIVDGGPAEDRIVGVAPRLVDRDSVRRL